jgi:membrane protein YqaA with SNARE-associated domain
MLISEPFDPWLLILTATAGNVLGSLLNWLMGRYLHGYRDRRWFPVSQAGLSRAERVFKRWGVWMLLLSWVPIIGDPLTLVSGLLRVPLKVFLPIVLVAKAGRYIAISGVIFLF